MFAWISLGVVLVSTFTFVLGTFPEFQKEEDTGQPPPYPEAVLVMEAVGKSLVEGYYFRRLNKNSNFNL